MTMKVIFPESSSPSFDFCSSSNLSGSDNTSSSAGSYSNGGVVDKSLEGNEVSSRSSVSVCGAIDGKEATSRFYCTLKPHKGNDLRWECVKNVVLREGELGFSNFRLVKKLGFGDIGSVYLAELRGTGCVFAMKVMDRAMLVSRKKVERAKTERDILASLDHPFLPTLYSHFETDKFSCFVMEFCCGGDLHLLRQLQPEKRFPEQAARFYAAEVLLGLEYLHMMGVIYRDLKPENVLIREDGHIMLSDFDLSLKCNVNPTLISSKPCQNPSCKLPVCAEPSCFQPTCLRPRFLRRKEARGSTSSSISNLYLLVAEPIGARSNSFVGTHEYLAPEIIRGDGHGSAVDWWTFGVFIYELLYGKTPFKGNNGNRETLFNVIGQSVYFPGGANTSFAAKDLIEKLLVKEPQKRLGFKKGAAEIKKHPFFEGVNWALIRSATPPVIPAPYDLASENETWISSSENMDSMRSSASYLELEFF